VAFVHDEIILEGPEAGLGAAAERLQALMIAGMEPCVPDIPVIAEPFATRRWVKEAKPTYRGGQLVVTEIAT
jgi:DNA polymerase I-like protein with 3'-5' exonuclease and polymerase domains